MPEFSDYKSPISARRLGRREIAIAETRCRADGVARRVRRRQTAVGRPHRRLPAHDDPDRRADRNAAGARRYGAVELVQHLLDQDHAAAAIAARGIPVFAWKGETEEEYECASSRPCAARLAGRRT